MINWLLGIDFIRKKLLFHLKHKYFHELGHSIPIESGYWADLLEKDSYDSFSEIFIKQEYLKFIPDEPISRILDIGAHYGYFSLWLQSKHPEIELSSLMIEPSPSCARSLRNLVNQEKLDGRFSYLQKAIGVSNFESSPFYDRSHMAGSRYSSSESEKAILVQNLTEAELVKNLEPPYDLIKCDIEGSEWEFLNDFQNLITASKYLLLEWHSWHEGGGGLSQIEKFMHSINFRIFRSSEPISAIGREGEVGLILFKKQGKHLKLNE
jgi:FkbM family methyltransferase